MKKIDFMMFDLDGTLADTGGDLVQGINHTLRELDLGQKSAQEIIGYVGDGLSALMSRALGENNLGLHEEAMRIFIDYYGNHLLENTSLYPHVNEVLDYYKNVKKIILTNKRYTFALQIARGLRIEEYFMEIVGVDSTPFYKPDRRVIDHFVDKYKIDRAKTVMIGDGINDVLVAQNAGIISCAFLNGMGNRNDLLHLKADYYCEDLLELNSLFEKK
jgi:phosphoglycolate phosphatase